ncbi:MAG: single-stranded-DNA-specific exonuclease RecJ [Nitrospirae bacterium]|nr:MAG: single-stranded-DNA-specific exonuclease RecJ [Nitrospirota bacterium]
MPARRWLVQKTNPDFIRYLSRCASISTAFAQILINRGIKTPSDIYNYLDPTIDNLEPPDSLGGIAEASRLIKEAVSSNKKILVHGDYDTDGLTGTAILVIAIRNLGGKVDYFIPERLAHGYGFNAPGVRYAKETGADIILTVDCGITSLEATRLARDEGMGVIITDHHEPKLDESGNPVVPPADIVINPRLSNPSSTISGSMVAFKLALSLLGQEAAMELIDLATLGTIADIVPLIGENRIITKEGLRRINESPRPGLLALKEVSRINGREVTANGLAYTLIPRLNASGRVDKAREVISLLISDNYNTALPLAERLNELNLKRQEIQEEIYQEAKAMLDKKGYHLSIVLASENWHEGVVGIVASRLAEEFYRPSFVFNIKDGIAKGSARSIPPLNLYDTISACSNILLSYGGHKQAAGIRLKEENLPLFEEAINNLLSETLTDEDLIPLLTIDASVTLRDVNFSLVREINKMEPFGCGNPSPLLGAKGCEVVYPKVVGKGHLKMGLRHRSVTIDCIGFDMGEHLALVEDAGFVDAVFTPTINEWERGKGLQLRLHALRPAETD